VRWTIQNTNLNDGLDTFFYLFQQIVGAKILQTAVTTNEVYTVCYEKFINRLNFW